jgi:uncharacterized protein (TIGR02145 family)
MPTPTETPTPTPTATPIPPFVQDYGYLYNWYTIVNANNIANTDWHVATRDEFDALSTFLGGNSVSGGKMKEIGTTYWLTPNTDATNEVGFNARGSGNRDNNGDFLNFKYTSFWWVPSDYDPDGGEVSVQSFSANYITGSASKKYGHNVRLVRDTTSKTNGQTGTYTGNDGKIYNTICIDTTEWLSENLEESKYRGGTIPIPELQDNTDWANDTTGARCYYVIP